MSIKLYENGQQVGFEMFNFSNVTVNMTYDNYDGCMGWIEVMAPDLYTGQGTRVCEFLSQFTTPTERNEYLARALVCAGQWLADNNGK